MTPVDLISRIARAMFGTFGRWLGYQRKYHRTYYRRQFGKSVWHSSNQCAGWPSDNFEETSIPGFGVCPECMRIEHRDLRFFGPTSRS